MILPPPIRVLLIDASADTGVNLSAAHDLILVGSGSSAQALDLCLALNPDIVLFEVYAPDSSTVEVIRAIRVTAPLVRVLVLSSAAEIGFARAVLNVGASGFLLNYQDRPDLAVSLRAACRGRIVLSPVIAHALIQSDSVD